MSVSCLELIFTTPQWPKHPLLQVYSILIQLFLNSMFVISSLSLFACLSRTNTPKVFNVRITISMHSNYLPLSNGFMEAWLSVLPWEVRSHISWIAWNAEQMKQSDNPVWHSRLLHMVTSNHWVNTLAQLRWSEMPPLPGGSTNNLSVL